MNLRAYDTDGQEKFSVALPPGQPVGKPKVSGDSIIMAGKSGWIVTIDPDSGRLIGKTDLQQPISATPFGIGTNLLVPGKEGVIYIVKVPVES
jgi:hypothetical protein